MVPIIAISFDPGLNSPERSRTNRAVCREISPRDTRWRGKKGKIGREPTERCVRKFRPVPRGGAKKRNDPSRTERAVCREISPCATRWREKKKEWSPINDRSRTDRAVCQESSPCATRWNEKRNSVGDPLCNELWICSFRFFPRSGIRIEGNRRRKNSRNVAIYT